MEEDLLQGPEDGQPGRDVIIIFAVFFELSLAPFSLLLGWFMGRNPLEKFQWSASDALRGAAAAVPLIALFISMLTWPIGPLARVKRFCEKEVVPLFDKSYWSEIALVSLASGVGEEMLFRGLLQPSFTEWWGPASGLVLASTLYGFLHPISWRYSVVMTCVGFYYGLVWERSGNLLTAMVTHTLYAFITLGFLIRVQHGDDE